jgi:protease-4
MERLWMAHAEEAAELGLIDRAVDLADLSKVVGEELEGDIEWDMDPLDREHAPKMDLGNPFAALSILTREPETKPKRESIAILHIDGAIVDGDSSMGGFSGEPTVGSRTVRNALQDIQDEDLIKGVIVRIDSPGGSATASEVIWQGLRRVAEHKPVWVSVGSMAASGGYYLAVAGDRVYVNPSSIVGSIGVVGGKISMEGLYDRLKVNVVSRSRGPLGGLFSSAPWGENELRIVRNKMTETYNLFASRVEAGRPDADLDQIGEGRLFTGDKALRMRMADALGGLDVALEDLASELELGDYDVMHFPGPKSLPEVLDDFFGGAAASAPLSSPLQGVQGAISRMATPAEISAVGRQLLGTAAWPQVSRQIDTLMLLREEPVILLSPSAVIFR